MIGYIYEITNDINSKVYVGQTIKNIEERFREHKSDAKYSKRSKLLHNAMNKYGCSHFNISVLEVCDLDMLNEREIYWIDKLDTFNNGYNLTLGGDGKRVLCLDEVAIVSKYKELKCVKDVAAYFFISSSKVREILKKYDIDLLDVKSVLRHKRGVNVYCIDISGNRYDFESYKSAAEWCISVGFTSSIYTVVASGIRNSVFKGSFLYGCRWYSDDYSDDYLLDVRHKVHVQSLVSAKKQYELHDKDLCPICGQSKLKDSKLCIACYKSGRLFDGKLYNGYEKPSRDALKDLIRSCTFVDIAKRYGVCDNTVRKWCKKYMLPFRVSDIEVIADDDWLSL